MDCASFNTGGVKVPDCDDGMHWSVYRARPAILHEDCLIGMLANADKSKVTYVGSVFIQTSVTEFPCFKKQPQMLSVGASESDAYCPVVKTRH